MSDQYDSLMEQKKRGLVCARKAIEKHPVKPRSAGMTTEDYIEMTLDTIRDIEWKRKAKAKRWH